MSITPMNELNLQNKVVLIREDLNVPIEEAELLAMLVCRRVYQPSKWHLNKGQV